MTSQQEVAEKYKKEAERQLIHELTGSTLDPARFVLGTAANLAAAQVIYDSATGKLFFDADGTGGTAKVLVAIFSGAVVLGADDFALI